MSLPLDLEFPRAATVAQLSLHIQGLTCNQHIIKVERIYWATLCSVQLIESVNSCWLTAYVPGSLKYLVFFIPYIDPKKHRYLCVNRWKRKNISNLFSYIISSRPGFEFKSLEVKYCVLSPLLGLKRPFRHTFIMFSYHLYINIKNISVTVIIHLMTTQNVRPRRNFNACLIQGSHLQMAKLSPREQKSLDQYLSYQFKSYYSPFHCPYCNCF